MTTLETTFENKSLTGRRNDIWSGDLLYSQLFSSLLTGSELYLSNTSFPRIRNTAKKSKPGLLKRTKDNLLNLLTNPTDGIEKLVTTADSKKNIDMEHELMEIQENIDLNKEHTIDLNKEFDIDVNEEHTELKYSSTASNFSPIKALRKFYASFVNYGKKGYAAIKTNTNKVVGNVKITIYKFANTSWFLKASLNPQWNFAPASALDKDAHAPAETSNASISEENAQYEIGYRYLRYRG